MSGLLNQIWLTKRWASDPRWPDRQPVSRSVAFWSRRSGAVGLWLVHSDSRLSTLPATSRSAPIRQAPIKLRCYAYARRLSNRIKPAARGDVTKQCHNHMSLCYTFILTWTKSDRSRFNWIANLMVLNTWHYNNYQKTVDIAYTFMKLWYGVTSFKFLSGCLSENHIKAF